MQLLRGPTSSFSEALDRKYAIMQQQADSQKLTAEADANLNTVRAGLMPAESAANIGLTGAQAGLARSTARKTDEEGKVVGGLAAANIFNTRAQGGVYVQQGIGLKQLNKTSRSLAGNRGLVSPGASQFDQDLRDIMTEGLGYSSR